MRIFPVHPWARCLVGLGLLASLASCREKQADPAVLEARSEEIATLRKQLDQSERELGNTRERLLITQQALNGLESEYGTLKSSHAVLEDRVRVLTGDNADLRGQLSLVSDRLRGFEAAQAEAKARKENRNEVGDAGEVPVPAPFSLYGVSFVGEMEFEGKKRMVGRFSITNHTDQPLRIFANSLFRTIRLEVPPHGATNGIHMVAKQGDTLRVNTTNHTVSSVWQ